MDYAVITTGGKQYKVVAGQKLEVENLGQEVDSKIAFDKVLLLVNGDKVELGKPFISGAVVNAKVLENGKGEKIRVAKFKAKARFRRVTGHRQHITTIEIESIGQAAKSTKKA
jgi:large subunit ribosomal protein L21